MNNLELVPSRRQIGVENYWFISLAGLKLDDSLTKKLGEAIRKAATVQVPRGILISLIDVTGYENKSDFTCVIAAALSAVSESCRGTKLALVMSARAIANAKINKLQGIVGLYEDEEVAIADRENWPAL